MGLEPEARRGLRLIVCDAAPLLSLQESDLLEILPLAGRIYIPPAVRAELRTLDPVPEWLEIAVLDTPFEEEARAWVRAGILDSGESEAIALIRQLGADWLLTDDAAYASMARAESPYGDGRASARIVRRNTSRAGACCSGSPPLTVIPSMLALSRITWSARVATSDAWCSKTAGITASTPALATSTRCSPDACGTMPQVRKTCPRWVIGWSRRHARATD